MTPTPPMTDGDALYAAILDDPADDTARLVYADWLDEHTEKVACERCGGTGCTDRYPGCDDPSHRCPDCDGSGTIPDACGDRAEFIRVQCEIARIPGDPDVPHPSDNYLDLERKRLLRRRERELWAELVGHAHDTGGRLWGLPVERVTVPTRTVAYDRETYVVSRGFVSAITCDHATLFGRPCDFCQGRGHFQTSGSYAECPRCIGPLGVGTGRVPGLAADLFARHPITVVRFSDLRAWEYVRDGRRLSVWADEASGLGLPRGRLIGDVPAALFAAMWERLPDARSDGPDGRLGEQVRYLVFDTVADAESALSAAAVALGRAAAGLPPLPGGGRA